MKKILLHTCCAPCTTYVNKKLMESGFEVEGLFYNPNINPLDEYEARILAMGYYATAVKLKVAYGPKDIELVPGNCEDCYRTRLEKAAEFGNKSGCDYFSTTLLISPHQNHALLKQIGEEAGNKYGIEFYYQDFRAGFRESQKMAKEMELYLQKYCGCGVRVKEETHAGIS